MLGSDVIDAAWTVAFNDLDAGWGGNLTRRERDSYRRILERGGFSPRQVAEAVQRLALSGREFYPRPAAAQIVTECRAMTGQLAPGDFDASTWGELHLDAEDAAYRYRLEEAADKLQQTHGPIAASWLANGGGYSLLRDNTISTGEKFEQGRRSYETFVRTERERDTAGRPVAHQRPGARLRAVEPLRALGPGE